MTTIIFTDLDGTLLHPRTYSFEKALPALGLAREQEVPVVLVSSKTRAEIEVWRERLGNRHPFISENGGGIFIPDGYFPGPVEGDLRGGYRVITLGMPYGDVRRRFTELRTGTGAPVRGFGDMTPEQVRDLTGLPEREVTLAMQRDFDEPFLFEGKTDERFLRAIGDAGLRWTRGRLFHIMGAHDKGRAVEILAGLYAQALGPVETVGIGDDLNDLPFLLTVDRPVLVRKPSGLHEPTVNVPGLLRTDGVGPRGWNEAVLQILGEHAPAERRSGKERSL